MKLTLGNQEIEISEEQRKSLLEDLKAPDEVDNWPQEGNTFWTIENFTSIKDYRWFGSNTDNKIKSVGLVFRTKEEAQAHVRYLKALTRVKGSSNWKPNWEENTPKYSVYFDYRDHDLHVESERQATWIGIVAYYETYEAAHQAIKDHKEDFLILAGVK